MAIQYTAFALKALDSPLRTAPHARWALSGCRTCPQRPNTIRDAWPRHCFGAEVAFGTFFPSELSWVAEPSAPPPSPPFAKQNPTAATRHSVAPHHHKSARGQPTPATASSAGFLKSAVTARAKTVIVKTVPLHRSQAASGQRPSSDAPVPRRVGPDQAGRRPVPGLARPARQMTAPWRRPPLTWPAHRSRDRAPFVRRHAAGRAVADTRRRPARRSRRQRHARVLRGERPRRKGRQGFIRNPRNAGDRQRPDAAFRGSQAPAPAPDQASRTFLEGPALAAALSQCLVLAAYLTPRIEDHPARPLAPLADWPASA